ncbi:MAG: hydantoinase B/oxoprolinase family protein, partial [Salinirussus sp.]
MSDLDPATLEVIRNKLSHIAEEMQGLVMNTAYSPLWHEAGDLSSSILSPDAEIVGQSERVIPVHVASMRNTVAACIEQTGGYDALEPGDMFIQNDPYAGTTHLPNVTLARPVFAEDTLLGFAAVQGHWVDIGGAATASYHLVPDTEIIEEGLRIPSAKLYRAGERNDAVVDILMANTRDTEERRGDLDAQLAGVRRGCERFRELVGKYDAETVSMAIETILANDEARMRDTIAELPNGTYEARDFIEPGDLGDELLPIELSVTIDGSDIVADFEGTADQVSGGINSSWSSTEASAHYGFKLALDPGGPGTLGSYRPIEIRAPEGSILNPTAPAPVVAQHSAGTRAFDVVVKALAEVDPALVFGAGEGSSNILSYESLADGSFNYSVYAGGMGACPARDGLDGRRSGRGNTGVQPVERVETAYDWVTIDEYGIVPDSGGAGRNRGGAATTRLVRFADPTRLTIATDRTRTRPFGVAGGDAGASAAVETIPPEGESQPLPAKGIREVSA